MYDNFSSVDPIGVPTGDVYLSTSSGVPRGWAVWFELGKQQQGPLTVTHMNRPQQSAGWYREQRVPDSHSVILWFRDMLRPGDMIIVHPSP
jgi:hypothetical protein